MQSSLLMFHLCGPVVCASDFHQTLQHIQNEHLLSHPPVPDGTDKAACQSVLKLWVVIGMKLLHPTWSLAITCD